MRRLHRSRSNYVLGGVCGGLGDYFDLDPVLVRLIWLILILFGGIGLFLYIIAWIIIPQETRNDERKAAAAPAYSRGRLWWGLALVIIGVFLWGSQYRIIYWPVIPGVHLHSRDFIPLILVLVGGYLLFVFGRKTPESTDKKVQRLYRSTTDRKLGGVCGGFAKLFKIDSTMVRVIWVAGSFFYGVGVMLYIILMIALPEEPAKKVVETEPPKATATKKKPKQK